MKLLLVDDELECLESLKMALEPLNHQIMMQNDPMKAYDLIEHENIDLVIADYNMPGMTGIDLLKEINKFDKNIKVIIITAMDSIENVIASINNHAYSFFTKPIDLAKLIKIIRIIEKEKNEAETGNTKDKKINEEYGRLKKIYGDISDQLNKINYYKSNKVQ